MMSTSQHTALTVEELERLIKGVEPGAFLMSPRLLRRVIKRHRHIGGLALLVPHRKGYVIDREALLRYVTPAELGARDAAALPPFIFLLARPDADRLASATPEQTL